MSSIKSKLNRKLVAVVAVFALLMTGTGIASLATLTDQLTVQNKISILTIDFQGNGSKSITHDFGTVVQGDVLPRQDILFKNNGTGSLTFKVTASVATVGAGTDLDNAITYNWNDGGAWLVGAVNGKIAQGVANFPVVSLAAGETRTLGLQYLLAATPAVTTTTLTHLLTFTATH